MSPRAWKMSPRAWKMALAIVMMVFPFGVRGQTYDELSAMVSGPWHHVPNPLSSLQFNRDEAKCRVISAQKANTANAFSLPQLALSTANLYSAVQPGGSLFGL